MPSKPARTFLTIIMDVLIALAIAETARLVVAFFGTLAAQGWGEVVQLVTNPITIPFGVEAIKTPYGGVFDVDSALSIVVYMLAEWVLSIARSRE